MDGERCGLLTRSVAPISRRDGLLAGMRVVLGARIGGLAPVDAGATKKRTKRAAVECA